MLPFHELRGLQQEKRVLLDFFAYLSRILIDIQRLVALYNSKERDGQNFGIYTLTHVSAVLLWQHTDTHDQNNKILKSIITHKVRSPHSLPHDFVFHQRRCIQELG